jgi:hypothetical protein
MGFSRRQKKEKAFYASAKNHKVDQKTLVGEASNALFSNGESKQTEPQHIEQPETLDQLKEAEQKQSRFKFLNNLFFKKVEGPKMEPLKPEVEQVSKADNDTTPVPNAPPKSAFTLFFSPKAKTKAEQPPVVIPETRTVQDTPATPAVTKPKSPTAKLSLNCSSRPTNVKPFSRKKGDSLQQKKRIEPKDPTELTLAHSTTSQASTLSHFHVMISNLFLRKDQAPTKTKDIAQKVTQSLLAQKRLDKDTVEKLKDPAIHAQVIEIMQTLDHNEIGKIRRLIVQERMEGHKHVLEGLFPQSPGTTSIAASSKVTLQTYWWGYSVHLHPEGIAAMQSAGNITTASLSMVTAVITTMPFLTAYAPVIASFIALQFAVINALNKGGGVILTASWALPVLLVPSSHPVSPTSKDSK